MPSLQHLVPRITRTRTNPPLHATKWSALSLRDSLRLFPLPTESMTHCVSGPTKAMVRPVSSPGWAQMESRSKAITMRTFFAKRTAARAINLRRSSWSVNGFDEQACLALRRLKKVWGHVVTKKTCALCSSALGGLKHSPTASCSAFPKCGAPPLLLSPPATPKCSAMADPNWTWQADGRLDLQRTISCACYLLTRRQQALRSSTIRSSLFVHHRTRGPCAALSSKRRDPAAADVGVRAKELPSQSLFQRKLPAPLHWATPLTSA